LTSGAAAVRAARVVVRVYRASISSRTVRAIFHSPVRMRKPMP
jgi:hypothetical protein